MSRIRGRDTSPERALRAALRRKGEAYRSYKVVAGAKVDIVLPNLGTVIFVHGCFWHGCRKHYDAPSSNAEFWRLKVERNHARDLSQRAAIRKARWRVVTVWEHSLSTDIAADLVVKHLVSRSSPMHR